MNITRYLLALLLTLTGAGLQAQESALYRDVQRHYKRGMHFFDRALYGQALEELDQVIKAEPAPEDERVPLYQLRARLHAGLSALYLKQPDAEKRLLHFVEREAPSNIANRAQLALGNFYYNERDYNAAILYLSKVSQLELTNEEIIEQKFKLGYSYFVKKRFDKAKSLFQQIRDSKTQYYYPANYYYGITEFFDGDYDKALDGFNKAKQSKRYKNIVPVYLVQIYFARRDYSAVIREGKGLVNNNSIRERDQVAQLVGQSYFELGNYRQALPLLERYVTATPKVRKEALYQLGYTQYKVGKYREAIENFKQLNTLKDSLGQSALYYLGDAQLKVGKKRPARQAFKGASTMNFNKTLREDALINYAKLSYELGFDNDAITALQTFPNTSDYYNEAQNLMAEVFLNTRDYDKALQILRKIPQKTAKLKETYQKVAYFRGAQLYKNKQYDQAIALYDESMKQGNHKETKALAYFWKGEALYQKGQHDAAIDEYDKYFVIAPLAPRVPDNSSEGVAYYGLGYAYIRKNDYGNAARQFGSAVNTLEKNLRKYNDKYVTNFVYPDALLRYGDCLLYNRQYEAAKAPYRKVVDRNYPNQDYALYQLSMIYNIQDDVNTELALIERIVTQYPNSRYADDAYYSKGNTLFNIDRSDLAIEAYEAVLNKYPNSEWTNNALLKLGLVAYSLGRNEEALNYYKAVFRNDPQSSAARDALGAIKEIYIQQGNPDAYFNFVNTVQGVNVNQMERDSLTYASAQLQFDQANWDGAVNAYTTYLNRFPTGLYTNQAHFNRGEALFDLRRYDEALQDYAYISGLGNSSYAATANHRAANITYYIKQDFGQALTYYTRLEQTANTEELLFEAQQLGLRSAFYSEQYDQILGIAPRFLANARATDADRAEAYYYMGKAYLQQRDFDAALTAFNQNISLSGDDKFSAEARYWRAYLAYQKRDLKTAKDLAFDNNKALSGHPYWLVKSFILLADIYTEEGNLFQAKATLQSVVDNYDGDQDLLNEAKEKLRKVKLAEANKSRLRPDNPNGDLEMLEDN